MNGMSSLLQLVEQVPGLFHIERVEPLGEAT
jgi:hypothetical protein